MRVPTLPDLVIIVALGFVASWVSHKGAAELAARSIACARDVAGRAGVHTSVVHAGTDEEAVLPLAELNAHQVGRAIDRRLAEEPTALSGLSAVDRLRCHVARFVTETTGESMWKYVLVTTLGLLLSFTRARNLEGAGASRIGSVMLYLLVACIGAHASFADIAKAPGYVIVGLIWMVVHVIVLLAVGWLIRAPIFFIAVGSQANIGGAASAPIVAAAYHPSLAPVGVLLAVAGYVLGTYAGFLCGTVLKWVAGAG